ncbi:MAG: adenylyl-sulfate kinase [Anaerolineales bacterium]|jgi:adenylylsulfate kinase
MDAFALWLTGLPACGKTTLANLLAEELNRRNMQVQVLDSDQIRKVLTPDPTYSAEERDWFYETLAYIGKLLVQNSVNTIIAATAHRLDYRQRAREYLPNFIEVYVQCSIDTCMKRDQKGIYKKALGSKNMHVPGVQELYEEPDAPAIIVDTEENSALECVQKILAYLEHFGSIPDEGGLLSNN